MMFGLAITTTAAGIVIDTGGFARRGGTTGAGRGRFALRLHRSASIWFAVAGSWYVFGTWPPVVRSRMLAGPTAALTLVTALGPGLVWLLLLAQRRGTTRPLAWATAAAQLGVLALQAVSRQVVQNTELARWYDVAAEPVQGQWGPLAVFLILFGEGIGLIGWMIGKAVAAARGHLSPDPLVAEIDIH